MTTQAGSILTAYPHHAKISNMKFDKNLEWTNELHIVPPHDLIEHDTATWTDSDCICGPRIKMVENIDPDKTVMGWLIIHNSLDDREEPFPDSNLTWV